MLEFEWDNAKRAWNLAKHDLDLEIGRLLFDGRLIVTMRSRFAAELRYLTTGLVDARFCTLVWTERQGRVRLISLRRARRGERERYYEMHGG